MSARREFVMLRSEVSRITKLPASYREFVRLLSEVVGWNGSGVACVIFPNVTPMVGICNDCLYRQRRGAEGGDE
jgi:hypothetical protein